MRLNSDFVSFTGKVYRKKALKFKKKPKMSQNFLDKRLHRVLFLVFKINKLSLL